MRISIKNFMPNLWMDLMWIYSTNRNPLIWKHRLRTWRKRAISNRTSNGSTDWAISSRLKYARWVEQVQVQLFISIHTNIDTRETIEKKKEKELSLFGFQHPKKKQRVRVIEYWIETARECFNIGNFNSLMAIIAGLNISPISRLKKTVSRML